MVLEHLGSLFTALREVEDFDHRITTMQQNLSSFEADARALVLAVDAAHADLPPDQAVTLLNEKLALGRTAEVTRRQLEQQLLEHQVALDQASLEHAAALERLEELCRQAGCAQAEELADCETRSDEVKKLRSEQETIDRQLAAECSGASMEALLDEAGHSERDSIESRIAELNQEHKTLDTQRTELDRRIGSLVTQLGTMGEQTGAEEAVEKAETFLARAREHVERYLVLRTASLVLRRENERYRKANQGPIISRTNELFPLLTLGSFSGVRVDYDEDGKPLLVGVRSGDTEKGVNVEDGMSDGTRDQLFLALRLASLERHLSTSGPMPFVVDDILVGFDDGRSKATLQVLGKLSAVTQVVFFTHHRRLVDLARQTLDDQTLFVHELPGPLARSA